MRQYLRRWPFLLLIIPGALLGLLFAYRCSSYARRCGFTVTPADYPVAAVIGGAVALPFALAAIALAVVVDRRKAALVARFPGALLITGRVDGLTVHSAAQLGVALPRGSYVLVAVGDSGIQLWQGDHASHLILEVPWSRVQSAAIGEPHGDPTAIQRTRMASAYERLAIGIVRDDAVVQLQFGVVGETHVARGSLYTDAYDLRVLIRQINGYKAVHDRGA